MHKRTSVAIVCTAILLAPFTAFAEESCEGSPTTGATLSKTEIETKLHAQGYTTIRELRGHNGCYEAKGLDSKGKRFELEVDAHTGKITKAE